MKMADTLPDLHQGEFSGPQEFAAIVRSALAHAAQAGWREMVWSDVNFQDWPLRESAAIEALDAWAGQGRRLVLLAQNFDALQRTHARFVSWRIRWDHVIECRVCRQMGSDALPSALWTPTWFVRRLDLERSRGVCSVEARPRTELKELLDEYRKQGSPGFPASTLGL
jgi:hypothetical protein